MEPTSVAITLGLVNGAIDAAKKAVNMAKDLNNIDLKQQVGEVVDAILDLKVRLLELEDEKSAAISELESIKTDIIDADQMKEVYQLFERAGRHYCPHCWIVEKRLGPIVYTQSVSTRGTHVGLQCTRCKQEFSTGHNPIRSGH